MICSWSLHCNWETAAGIKRQSDQVYYCKSNDDWELCLALEDLEKTKKIVASGRELDSLATSEGWPTCGGSLCLEEPPAMDPLKSCQRWALLSGGIAMFTVGEEVPLEDCWKVALGGGFARPGTIATSEEPENGERGGRVPQGGSHSTTRSLKLSWPEVRSQTDRTPMSSPPRRASPSSIFSLSCRFLPCCKQTKWELANKVSEEVPSKGRAPLSDTRRFWGFLLWCSM